MQTGLVQRECLVPPTSRYIQGVAVRQYAFPGGAARRLGRRFDIVFQGVLPRRLIDLPALAAAQLDDEGFLRVPMNVEGLLAVPARIQIGEGIGVQYILE